MKQQRPSTEANREAAQRCFEIYGGDIAKWPAEKREAYGALARSDELTEAREEAATLDGFLNAATAPRASHDLKNRIKAAIDLPSRAARTNSFAALLSRWRLAPTGIRSGMLAGAGAGLWASLGAGIGVLGLASGFLTANSGAGQGPDYQTAEYEAPEYEAPEYEAYAYLEYSDGIFAEEEGVQWDVD